MDLKFLINLILNQSFNQDDDNNNSISNNSNDLSNVHDQTAERPAENSITPFPDFHKYLGVFAVLQEFGELLRRIMDKNYAESRKYESTGRHEGKVAVMTNATNGICAVTALYLNKIGYKVFYYLSC